MTYTVFMMTITLLLIGMFVLMILDDKYDVVEKFDDWFYETVVKIQKRLGL